MTDQSIEDASRKQFEAWYEANAMPLESNWFYREKDGGYKLNFVENTWEGWQASRQSSQSEPVGKAMVSPIDANYTIATFNIETVPEGTNLYAAPQQAIPAKPPRWYQRSEIVQALKRMNYCVPIQEELADWFTMHLQYAFNKGFQKGQSASPAAPIDNVAEALEKAAQVAETVCFGRQTPDDAGSSRWLEAGKCGRQTAQAIRSLIPTQANRTEG
jgi:hypothetical protein